MVEVQKKYSLLSVEMNPLSQETILEKIKKDIGHFSGFFHIVSLNPEILTLARERQMFKRALETAQIQIADGTGVVAALTMKYHARIQRVQGVDLFEKLLDIARDRSVRVMFLGGKPNLAVTLAKCYQSKYPQSEFFGLEGYKDIQAQTEAESRAIFSIVAARKPHFIFAAFGSPSQEEWFYANQEHLKGIICMGVGGGFDFISGEVKRAPAFLRSIGLEWLFRLLMQPWRWRRQLRLISFCVRVFPEVFHISKNS